MKPGPGEGCSQGGRPPSSPPCRCWQRRQPAGESGLPPLPPRAHSPGEGAAGGLCVLPRIPTLSYTPNKARFFVHRSTGLRLGGSLMRMGRESPARGEDSGTGRPGRAGAQRAPPQSLKPRSAQGRGVARPSRARPAARSSSAAAAAMGKPPVPRGRDGTGSAAVLPGRPFRRRAQRRTGDVTPTVGRTRGASDWARGRRAAQPAGADRPVAGRGGTSAVRARSFERPGPCWAVAAMAAVPPEFHLPLAAADLLRDGGPGRYVVQEVLAARDLPPALAGKLSARPLPGRARSCRRLTGIPPPLSVLPQLSGPPPVRGARWPCWSTSTACTACCSEYGASTG